MKASRYTIGQLCKRSGLARSTLLYYDSIDLLKPSGRSASNYRVYTQDDLDRLQHICTYRQAGVPLDQIKKLLDAPVNKRTVSILEMQLHRMNEEIDNLRMQQRTIIAILQKGILKRKVRNMNKDKWVEIMRAAGIDDEGMHRWHCEFEKRAADDHQRFLEYLGIAPDEIGQIRQWSKELA